MASLSCLSVYSSVKSFYLRNTWNLREAKMSLSGFTLYPANSRVVLQGKIESFVLIFSRNSQLQRRALSFLLIRGNEICEIFLSFINHS